MFSGVKPRKQLKKQKLQPMYTISRIHTLIKPVMHGVFQRYVDACDADKHSKTFKNYDLLVAMLFAVFSNSRSLRVLEQRFNASPSHHYHLHTRTIYRSTLADALARKSITPFITLAQSLMQSANRKMRQDGKTLLYLLDSTIIDLRGRGFDEWTRPNHNSRGIKLHLLIKHGAQLPIEAKLSHTNVNDLEAGKAMPIAAGHTYVFDKGYCDYNWWHEIDEAGAYFTTRLKKNAAFTVLAENTACGEQILGDQTICFKHKVIRSKKQKNHYYDKALRRIEVAREDGETLVLVSNDHESSAAEIAENYKKRWQIELLFKWMKQHLALEHPYSRTENGVKLHILCVLIAYLLLRRAHQEAGETRSLHLYLAKLSASLFERPKTLYEHYRRRERRHNDANQLVIPLS